MIDLYKITDNELNNPEVSSGVKVVKPIAGAKLDSLTYFNHVLGNYNKTGRLLAPGEIGCTLSHLKIYEDIIKNNRSGVIFESDITLNENDIKLALNLCSNSNVDFIHLGWHPSIERNVYFKGKYRSDFRLYEINPHANFHGSYAYYLSPTAAKELLLFHKDYLKLTDCWAIFFRISSFKPYFWPIVSHPSTRTSTETQRIGVASNVLALSFDNIFFFIKKALIRNSSKMRLFKDIRPCVHSKNFPS
jgi:glycosyl transferase family 25